jgi:3-hydroxyisobutyrate dehydrogenase-like beta-hydroxyacid dehydrogenase
MWIGVGEVTTSLLSAGLDRAEGICSVVYKSPNRTFSSRASDWLARSKIPISQEPDDISRVSVFFSAVTPAAAESVATELSPYIPPNSTYIDLNSIAVPTVLRIAKLIERSGANFIDAAIMGPVPVLGLDVPILLSGAAAAEWHMTAIKFGLSTSVVSDKPGDASAVKMLWSIITKGTIGLYSEALTAAHRMGLLPQLEQLLAREYGQTGSEKMVLRFLRSTSLSGMRRLEEMEEVAKTLQATSVPAWTVQATTQWIRELAGMQSPGNAHTVEEVVAAISQELKARQGSDTL